ncbi:MAG TPA: TonB-dependent receptor, partial [Thermoanaerobaculia bacterium]
MRRSLVLALIVATPLFAQEKKIGEVTLFGEEQLKVEAATKTEIPISKAPSAVTVITAKQIHESGARTVPDLLRLVAGVNVRWNPMIQTVDIRGFGENPFSNRMLLLIDNVPFNSGDTGGFPLSPGFDFFPVQNIKRIEIVRGPGSSLYGENAFWGVINIVTLAGEDIGGTNAQLYGGSRSTGTVNAQYGMKSAKGSIYGDVRLLQSMFPMRFWIDDHSKFRASDIFVKGSHQDFTVEAYRHDDRLEGFTEPLAGSPIFPPTSQFASAHTVRQVVDLVTLKYDHSPQDALVTYAADVSWSHRNGMLCAGCHAPQEDPRFSQPQNHGYEAIADFRTGLKMIRGHDILFGLEARRLDRADHKIELSPEGQVVSGYDKIAVYAQDQFALLREKIRAVVGIRYDGKTKLFDAKTSPRVSLLYAPTDRLVVRSGYSTAFRFPNFFELYQASWFFNDSSSNGSFAAFPLSVFIPNPNLVPEEIRNLDVGAEYQISSTLSAKADLYRSSLRNFIVITPVTRARPLVSGNQFQNNPAHAVIRGGELELRANVARGFTGFVNYARQTDDQAGPGTDTAGVPLEFVYSPKQKVNFGVYGGPWTRMRASLEASWRGGVDAPRQWARVVGLPAGTIPTLDSYTLMNGRISYDLPFQRGTSRPIRLTLFGNNLLNKQVRETLIGVDTTLAGREFFGQVEVNF